MYYFYNTASSMKQELTLWDEIFSELGKYYKYINETRMQTTDVQRVPVLCAFWNLKKLHHTKFV